MGKATPQSPRSLTECVRLTISYHFNFSRLSKIWNMLRHWSVRRVKCKECYFMFSFTFLSFFMFFIKKCLFFIIFIYLVNFFFFFDEESNFCNRILTNQKQEFVIRDGLLNCRNDINIQFHWQFLITSFHFWLANILLWNFVTSLKKRWKL